MVLFNLSDAPMTNSTYAMMILYLGPRMHDTHFDSLSFQMNGMWTTLRIVLACVNVLGYSCTQESATDAGKVLIDETSTTLIWRDQHNTQLDRQRAPRTGSFQ